MNINALNNMFFAPASYCQGQGLGAMFDSCNKQTSKASEKSQSETLSATTDNNMSAECEAAGSIDKSDFEDTLTKKTSNSTTTENASDQTSENTDTQSASQIESDNTSSESRFIGMSSLICLGQNNLLAVQGSVGDEVNRVVGEIQGSTAGTTEQIVPASAAGVQTSAEALLNQAQNGEQTNQGGQEPDENIEFMVQVNEKPNQTNVPEQAEIKTGQDSSQQQNQSVQQQQEQNLARQTQITNITAEQASEKTEEQKGPQGDIFGDNLQNQNFSQQLAQQKSEAKNDSLTDLLSTANEDSQILASANEQKPSNQTVQNLENNNGDFAAQFGKAVSEQIQASISNSVKQGENEITVNLNPPELGRVSIKLQEENGQITGLLEFSKPEIKSEVEQLLPQLVRDLQDSGIAVKKLDVVQTSIDNSTTYQQYRDNTAGEGAFPDASGQQSDQNQSGSITSGYDWITGQSNYSADDYYSDSYINDDAMNVLV